ncbi:MAG: hypothetical protein SGJ10_11000 [Bacteroidota bacterium]|nr:hypothetical protein [Bacteroidota bacterium]
MLKRIIILFLAIIPLLASGQIITHEDSLAAGLQLRGNRATAISGYGEVLYTHDINNKLGLANLRRNVLFVGNRFNEKLSFFSELELENAKVEGGKASGEISLEQCFIKFDINRSLYVNAGFFTPRIGLLNENHLPTTFNANDRPVVETMLIPATWREVGVAIYGSPRSIPGFNYSIALMNGLNASGFSLSEGIRGGRGEGSNAQARQKAITAAVLYYYGPWRLQASSYVGGSVGTDNQSADILGLSTGPFGTPVFLNEANLQYRKRAVHIKFLAVQINVPDASLLNTAYSNNIANISRGLYAEYSYDIFYKKHQGDKQFNIFTRYEFVDMNAKLPTNGIANKYYTQQHIFAGFTWMPHRGVGVKFDYHYINNGEFNQQLVLNPPPYALPYYTNNHYINLGVCYSF